MISIGEDRSRNLVKKAVRIAMILALSFVVHAGTAHFIGGHLQDAAWFQYGSFRNFDERARNMIDGVEPVFFLTESDRTDLIQYPPGFPLLVGLVYEITGDRSASAVHRVLWPLDAVIVPILILGIGVTAFGWQAGYAGAVMAALSPLFALCGVSPSADAVTTWVVLAGVWILLAACKRQSWRLALASGVVLGLACWFRVNPLFMVTFWAGAMLLFVPAGRAVRVRLTFALVLGSFLVIAPIVIRNVVVFREFVLSGLNVGSNFWEGLGETEFGRANGFDYGDQVMIERERTELGLPEDFPLTQVWPDGIRRDRERSRHALAFISRHPFWYSGVMLNRMMWMLKVAGDPGPYYGSAGINCTPAKCLPEEWRGNIVDFGVTVLGGMQSVYRYMAMPLAAFGIFFGFKRCRSTAALLAATPLYYLLASSATHTELRYVLPMHGVLIVFGGLGLCAIAEYTKAVILREHI
jgi:4-amino-4-deoxy-L-arabinose transferase-like glycosyltransferase